MLGDNLVQNIPVIVSSCDKYRYLWDIQLQLFNKYWNDCPHKMYYLSENSELPFFETKLNLENIKMGIQTSGSSDWSYMIRMFLNNLDSEYFIYMQEDYVLKDYVDQKKLNKLINHVISNEISYVRFITSPPGNGNTILIDDDLSIKEIVNNSRWRTSLMCAIWKKSSFLELLNFDMNITPWRFEHINSSNIEKFYCLDLDDDDDVDIIPFLGIYGSSNHHGIYPEVVEFLKSHNLKMFNGSEINYEIRL